MPNLEFYKKTNILLKILSIIGIIIFYCLYLALKKNPQIIQQEEVSSSINTNHEITATQTNFKGLSTNLIPYEINAQEAFKISEDIYKLNRVEGFYFPDKENLNIKSSTGILNNANHSILLEGNVEALGYGFTVQSKILRINLITEEIFGNKNVQVNYKNCIINAEKFNVKDKNFIILEGNVKTMLDFK